MYQNKKNLIIRTRKKKWKKAQRAASIRHNTGCCNNTINHKNQFVFKAPLVFSIIKNPKETISFFDQLITLIKSRTDIEKSIFIDISQVIDLTTDALMYLLAIINNLNSRLRSNCKISGNAPSNPKIKKLFADSGFYHYVRTREIEPLMRDTDCLQIISGEKTSPELAQSLIDFTIQKGVVALKDIKFLYNMIIELMSNTGKHAYNNKHLFYPRWYCFANYEPQLCRINFNFMDTGEGIPATVKKNFAEKIDILKIIGDSKYVVSALNGVFRSETNERFRGKGLPSLYECCKSKRIDSIRIISNHADVAVDGAIFHEENIRIPLIGTLFSWKIDFVKSKGGT